MATIQEEWQVLVNQAGTSAQKARLTQLKKHYTKIIQDDPEGAALMLAMYELQFGLVKRELTAP